MIRTTLIISGLIFIWALTLFSIQTSVLISFAAMAILFFANAIDESKLKP